MTKEQFEQAQELNKRIYHISKVIDFIKQKREFDREITNIFITNEADDYIDLNNDEVDSIVEALERKKDALECGFLRL